MPDAHEVSAASSTHASSTHVSSINLATRFGARAVLAAVSLVLVALPFSLTLLLVEDRWGPLLRADIGATDRLHGYAVVHPGFVRAMQLFSDAGSTLVWLVVLAGTTVWLLWRRHFRMAAFVVITAVGSSLLNAVVKTAVHRLRPILTDPVAHAPGLSFPSGHAQAAVVGYSLLLFVLLPILHGAWRGAAVTVAVVMVVAIGFSRIALGVHFVSDVVGGLVLGAAWVAAMAAAFNAVRVDRGQSHSR